MFEALPASFRAPPPRARVITSALLCHAVLIAAAITSTASRGVSTPQLARDTIRVDLAPVAVQRERAPSVPAEPRLPAAPSVPSPSALAPKLVLPQLSVPSPVPAASVPGPFASPTSSLGMPDSAPSWFPSSEVDELPQLLTDPNPVYPDLLRRAGVSGAVEVEYVVGTNGLVESRSIRVLSTDHARFTAAVVQALSGARFKPARAVAVRVRQIIRFRSGTG
jgi:periplasmic protein TonB